MNKIPFALGTAAGVAAADQQTEASTCQSARGQAVFAGLVVSKRGKPFTVTSINADNLLTQLGEPIHPRSGKYFEPMRHLVQATMGGRGFAVRVVPDDMRIPVIRLKETATQQPAKVTDFDLKTCTLTASKSQIKGDGKDFVTIEFMAKDSHGNLITSLNNLQFQAISQDDPLVSEIREVNGSYYVDVMATRAMPFAVLLVNDGIRVGTLNVAVSVRPAIVDPVESSISIHPDVIDDDGHDFATVTFVAKDQDSNIVTDVDNIDFMINSPTSVNLTAIQQPTPGTYTVRVLGTSPGMVTVYPRQDKIVLAPLSTEVRLMAVTTGEPISPTTSQFDVFPSDLYGDGKDEVTMTLSAIAANGAMIKAIPNLIFEVKGTKNTYTVTPVEVSSGVYRGKFKSTDSGTFLVTPMEGANRISNLVLNLNIIKQVPIDASLSTLAFSTKRIINDGSDKAVLTATLLGAGGVPAAAARAVTFEVTKGQAIIDSYSESRPGILVMNVTSKYLGDIEVIVKQYGMQIGTLKAIVFSAPKSTLNVKNSTLILDKNIIQENGTDTILLRFDALDSEGWHMAGLTGLQMIATGFQSGGVTISKPIETVAGSGVYYANLTVTKRGSGTVRITLNGQQFGVFAAPFTVTPVHGAVEVPDSSFTLSARSIRANAMDTSTATITLIDGFGDAIAGKKDITLNVAGLTGINITPSPLEESKTKPGVYTAKISTLSDGVAVLTANMGGKPIGLPSQNINFERVRGIMDPAQSQLDIDTANIYDNSNQQATIKFTVRDGLGNVVSGLAVIFDTPNGSLLGVSPVREARGVYSATITGSKAGQYSIGVDVNGVNVAGKSVSLKVRPAPVLNAQATNFSHTGKLVADGKASFSVTLSLYDQYGDPIDDSTQYGLRLDNLPGVSIVTTHYDTTQHQMTWTLKAMQTFPAAGTIYPQYGGKDIETNILKFSFNVDPAPGVIDTTKSGTNLVALPVLIDGNNKATSTLTLALVDGYNDRVTGIASELSFECSIPSGVTISAVQETGAGLGVYTATIKASVGGAAVFTPIRNGTAIGTMTATVAINDVNNIVSVPDSTINRDKAEVFASALEPVTIHLVLHDALGIPIHDKTVELESSVPGLVFTTIYQTSRGTYETQVTCTHVGTYEIYPRIAGVAYQSLKTSVKFNAVPALDMSKSSVVFVDSVPADGKTACTITLKAFDQYGNPFKTATGLTLSIPNAPADLNVSPFMNKQDGTYVAQIMTHTVSVLMITIMVNGQPSTFPPHVFHFVPLHGVIDPSKTVFNVSPDSVHGDNTTAITLGLDLFDFYGAPIDNRTDVTFEIVPSTTDITITPTTDGGGKYHASLTSSGSGMFMVWALVAGSRVATPKPITIMDMHGVMDATKSSITAVTDAITATLPEQINFTPDETMHRYTTHVNIQVNDVFGDPVIGLTMGKGKQLEIVATHGTLPYITYIGETSPGNYDAWVWSDKAGNAVFNFTLNGKDSGVPGVGMRYVAPNPIDWSNAAITDTATNGTYDPASNTPLAVTIAVKDSLGGEVLGLDPSLLSFEIMDVMTGVTPPAITLSRLINNGDGTYSTTITGYEFGDDVTYIVSIKWQGTKVSGGPRINLDILAAPGLVSSAKSTFTSDKTEMAGDGKSHVELIFNPKDASGNNMSASGLDVVGTKAVKIYSNTAGAWAGTTQQRTNSKGELEFYALGYSNVEKSTAEFHVSVGTLVMSLEVDITVKAALSMPGPTSTMQITNDNGSGVREISWCEGGTIFLTLVDDQGAPLDDYATAATLTIATSKDCLAFGAIKVDSSRNGASGHRNNYTVAFTPNGKDVGYVGINLAVNGKIIASINPDAFEVTDPQRIIFAKTSSIGIGERGLWSAYYTDTSYPEAKSISVYLDSYDGSLTDMSPIQHGFKLSVSPASDATLSPLTISSGDHYLSSQIDFTGTGPVTISGSLINTKFEYPVELKLPDLVLYKTTFPVAKTLTSSGSSLLINGVPTSSPAVLVHGMPIDIIATMEDGLGNAASGMEKYIELNSARSTDATMIIVKSIAENPMVKGQYVIKVTGAKADFSYLHVNDSITPQVYIEVKENPNLFDPSKSSVSFHGNYVPGSSGVKTMLTLHPINPDWSEILGLENDPNFGVEVTAKTSSGMAATAHVEEILYQSGTGYWTNLSSSAPVGSTITVRLFYKAPDGETLYTNPYNISVAAHDEPDESQPETVVIHPDSARTVIVLPMLPSILTSRFGLVKPDSTLTDDGMVTPGGTAIFEFIPRDDAGNAYTRQEVSRLQFTLTDAGSCLTDWHSIVDVCDASTPRITFYGHLDKDAQGDFKISLACASAMYDVALHILTPQLVGAINPAVAPVFTPPASMIDVSTHVCSGGGSKIEVGLFARDAYGMPLPGLNVEFTATSPLVEFSETTGKDSGTYTAIMTAHSFDYDVNVEALVDGMITGLVAAIRVNAQDIPSSDPGAAPLPALSSRSTTSMYPVVAAADGSSEIVASIVLVDQNGEPITGMTLLLLAQPGCVAAKIGEVEEIKPGVYVAELTSAVEGPVIIAWYHDGMLIRYSQRGAFSVHRESAPAAKMEAPAPPPVIAVAQPVYISVAKDTIGPEEELALEADDLLVIAADDGDSSVNRFISIAPDTAYPHLWDLKLTEVSTMGITTILEMVRFSLDHNVTDAAGNPMWLPLQLQNSGSRLRALVKANGDFTTTFKGMAAEAFFGGYEGTLSRLTASDYRKALNALEASVVNYTAVLTLGIYDPTVIMMLAQHARDVRVDMFADVPPANDPISAMKFAAGLGLGMFNNVALYHFPHSSRDPITGEQVVFGVSGDAFLAKARGVVQVRGIGGWHFSPAGETRGGILRRSIQPLFDVDEIDREEYVRLRINPVSPGINGMWQIDDSLTTYQQSNGLHYQHVSSVLNALARDINDICSVLKHEPGDVLKIRMEKEIPILMDEYVRCGALVIPKSPMEDAFPYKFAVENIGFDSWHVRYAVCVVGTARRIQCEPQEIR